MSIAAFLASFDRVHHAMRRLIGDERASFDDCLDTIERARELNRESLDFLRQCRRVRNFLAHGNDIPDGVIAIDHTPECERRLAAITARLQGDRSIEARMIRWRDVVTAEPGMPIRPLMARMIEREYTHLPVMVGGLAVGVFDERVLFRAFARGLEAVTESTTVAEVVKGATFADLDPLDIGVMFAARRTRIHDLRLRLDLHFDRKDRISLVIVTETGRAAEKPLGILTVWDLTDLDL